MEVALWLPTRYRTTQAIGEVETGTATLLRFDVFMVLFLCYTESAVCKTTIARHLLR